ncbi:hypothetical protein SVTN_36200 [Streptomyces vietnamensis]|uniref:Uncharacterized protein n=1 Tax=Streptomyces vietnamensis TaxID=362257 RepID=A0A0B5I8P6_9ACTN|nr:hypothetical protein SVTN_36200 [Streptomyces vietnamensis]
MGDAPCREAPGRERARPGAARSGDGRNDRHEGVGQEAGRGRTGMPVRPRPVLASLLIDLR